MQLVELYHSLRVVALASEETLTHVKPFCSLLQLSLDFNKLVISSHELSQRISEEQFALHLSLQLLGVISESRNLIDESQDAYGCVIRSLGAGDSCDGLV